VPHAFDDRAEWFAGPFLFVRALHIVLYVWGLRTDPAHQAAVKGLAPWFLVAPAFVLAGALVDDPLRTWLWLAAVAIDATGALRGAEAGFRVSPSHFAERYALFIIIALGESIVAMGVGAAHLERDFSFAVAATVAFVGAAVIWWAYFDFPARAADRVLHALPPEKRAPHARDVFSFFHYPMVLGIILFAVAAKKTLEHPGDPLSEAGRSALGFGIGVYLLGFVLARLRAVRLVAWERGIGAGAVIAAALALSDLDALVLLGVVIGILALALLVEAVRLRELRIRVGAVPAR
jgi:low temperature requirement protein LtrA